MDELTRRGFVKVSAGAAVSASVLGAVAAPPAAAARAGGQGARSRGAKKVAEHNGVVAYLPDPHSDEVAVMHGEHTVIVHDRALAARLARHARHAG